MGQLVYKNQKALRCGYTTGSCAAAAAQAAATLCLMGEAPQTVELPTPKGVTLTLSVQAARWNGNSAVCAVQKDSGDDPDVTDGIRIFASVQKTPDGIVVAGGEGIGTVTRPGLACAVGEKAINPGPRAQITAALRRAADKAGYIGGLSATISAENGAEIARQTYNSHLGVMGGISILGTSGVVEPMSEIALTETTHLELDSLFAAGQREVCICPGNYGEGFVRDTLGIDIRSAVKCSNFIGDALDYALFRGFSSVLLVGHAGKLVKLAAGVMNTHSSVADGRQEIFTAYAALCGAERETLERLMDAVTVDACIAVLEEAGKREPVLQRIGMAIAERLHERVRERIPVEFIMFTSRYGLLASSEGAARLCERIKEVQTI